MNTQLSHAEAQSLPAAKKLVRKERNLILILSLCMALQMTGFVMILPLFARRFSEFGAGVELLGTSVMAGALAGTLAAPFMGALADRFGRRLLVLGSLAAYILAFAGYLFASSALAFVLLRALAGAFTAGLVPAVIGIVADLSPVDRRAQWIGIVSGGASVGWIAGPILGGLFYDRWGYSTAIIVSILMAIVTFLTAFFTVPETRRTKGSLVKDLAPTTSPYESGSLKFAWQNLQTTSPCSLPALAVLLCISFAVMFAWAFIEPNFMFYAYDELGWTTSMLGLVMSTFGVAMMLGEFGLSHMSDRLGRKPVIVLGVLLFSAQFIGLAFFRSYIWISVSFVIAGLGNALFEPALSASVLDMTASEHQARIQGIKAAAGSLGNILGPALAVVLAPYLSAQAIFLLAVSAVLFTTITGLLVLKQPAVSAASSAAPETKAV